MEHESATDVRSNDFGRTPWPSRVRARLARMYPERKVLLVVAAGSAVLIAVSLALTYGERASDWETIKTGSTHQLDLDAGDEVGIYFTAFLSTAIQFDIDPSDIECYLTDPVGENVVAFSIGAGNRAIDGVTRHDRVAAWRALNAGTHRLTCDEHGEYSIILAEGNEAWRSPIEPLLVLVAVLYLVAPIALIVLVGSLVVRASARFVASRRSKSDDTG